jgi:hypothetical protein
MYPSIHFGVEMVGGRANHPQKKPKLIPDNIAIPIWNLQNKTKKIIPPMRKSITNSGAIPITAPAIALIQNTVLREMCITSL